MSAAEAESATSQFNAHVEEGWLLLEDIYQRQGWKSLGYENFPAYVKARLKVEKSRAYQLVEAASVSRELSTIVEKPALNEAQARELSKAPGGARADVYREATKASEGGELTAKVIRETVERLGYGPNKWGARATESNLRDYARRFLNNSNEAQLAYVLILCLDSIPVRRLTAAADEVWEAITPEEKKALHARVLSVLEKIAGEAS